MLAKNAVQKLEMVKPLTTAETSMSTNTFMTSKKRPMVTTVRGNVKRTNNGLTMALANPRSSAAINSEPPSAKRKPLKI